MNVRDIMTTDAAVGPEATVDEVARMLVERHLSGVPVVDTHRRLLGLITENDLVAKQARVHLPKYLGILGLVIPIESRGSDEEIEHALAVNAEQLMEPDPPAVDINASVEDAATLMVDEDANPIPVLHAGQVVGLVSRRDIIRFLLLQDEDAG